MISSMEMLGFCCGYTPQLWHPEIVGGPFQNRTNFEFKISYFFNLE
jgi:hypothetical protein